MIGKRYSTLLLLLSTVLSMLCLSFAAVPLYRIFCKATGYGGATKKASYVTTDKKGTYKIKVRFNANTTDLPIVFYPKQLSLDVTSGEQSLAFYIAKNPSDAVLSGTAVYNVSPPQAGIYFNKIACFCFTQQTFAPHSEIVMPVSFFIDPKIESDPTTKQIREITLSYSFFPSKTSEALYSAKLGRE